MSEMDSKRTHWAILIGVGVTIHSTTSSQGSQDHQRDRSLKGAVPDVVTIKEYLRTVSKPVDITMLTASKPPSEIGPEHEILPTFENVVSALKRVINLGQPGQFVYIHYSGHGTRCSVRQSASVALALVLYDKYLYGEVLRSALARMVERKMFVTVVLDCCFSGSTLRAHGLHGADIRFIEYDPIIDAKSDDGNPFASAANIMRDSKLKSDQLLDPDGYTVIAACGPHENASEVEFAGGARRGALTYFLVDTLVALGRCGVQLTQQSLHQHLCARFHAEYPSQTPMRYGSRSISFFECLTADSRTPFVSVFLNSKENSVVLSAGQAHGVHQADEYVAYHYDASENVNDIPSQESVKVVVKSVGCLTSELATADLSDETRIRKGSTWKARQINSISPQRVRIRLMPCLPDRQKLEEAAQGHPFLCLSTSEKETESCIFMVTINDQSAYEIQDAASRKIPNLPTIPLGTASAYSSLVSTLGHAATFKFFEKIVNQTPDPSFENSFSLCCSWPLGQDGCYEVKHGAIWSITFKNLDESPKYLAIFNFNPSWQVSNLLSEAGEGDFLVVPPKSQFDPGEANIPLMMTVPAYIQECESGHRKGEDIIKVFVTSRPTTFPSMILPQIGDGIVRGSPDLLKRLLQRLSNNTSRAGVGTQGQWSCHNFTIRTFMEPTQQMR